MNNTNKANLSIIECPRDAMQGWHSIISTSQKINYLNALLLVGFDTLDFGSFVSPRAIPQMADTKKVLAKLDTNHTATKLLAIIANTRGAEEAVAFDSIQYLGFPFSISPTFQLLNTNSSMEESMHRVESIQNLCIKNNKQLVVYLSMGFGNPYGDVYNEDLLLHWANEIAVREIKIISLADTVGLATPDQIVWALHKLIPAHPEITIGVHLHSTASNWKPKMDAAMNAGCKRFDGSLNGIGGCPMAQNELVGNMNTSFMLTYLEEKGIQLKINKVALAECLAIADEIFQ